FLFGKCFRILTPRHPFNFGSELFIFFAVRFSISARSMGNRKFYQGFRPRGELRPSGNASVTPLLAPAEIFYVFQIMMTAIAIENREVRPAIPPFCRRFLSKIVEPFSIRQHSA